MQRTIFIFVNGIMTFPGRSSNWNVRAVTYAQAEYYFYGETVEYLTGPLLSRLLLQWDRAKKLIYKLQRYIDRGWNIHLVAHSNGGNVILNALQQLNWPRIETVHLISSANNADFEKTGLNWALETDHVGQVFIYIGGQDWALKLANWMPVQLILGYGALGLTGPELLSAGAAKKTTIFQKPHFGHGSWFKSSHFPALMRNMFDRVIL